MTQPRTLHQSKMTELHTPQRFGLALGLTVDGLPAVSLFINDTYYLLTPEVQADLRQALADVAGLDDVSGGKIDA